MHTPQAASRNSSVAAAIIGTGFMGHVHAEALRRLRIPIVGILGSTPEKSQNAAAELGIDRAYNSFADLLSDTTATAIHINTPNRHHYEMARCAIEAGRHVLCEKPLAMNSTESAGTCPTGERQSPTCNRSELQHSLLPLVPRSRRAR